MCKLYAVGRVRVTEAECWRVFVGLDLQKIVVIGGVARLECFVGDFV